MTESFKSNLNEAVRKNSSNNYGKENYNEDRFGPYKTPVLVRMGFVGEIVRHAIIRRNRRKLLQKYGQGLQFLWELLGQEDRKLLIDLMCFRIASWNKVKLPTNTTSYWEDLKKSRQMLNTNEQIRSGYNDHKLNKAQLSDLGFDLNAYIKPSILLSEFILEQYAYKSANGEVKVRVEKGDTVLDCGGCWGETALYFASLAGENGKVYSFEFIPNNIKIHNQNSGLNPHLQNRIHLVPHPVFDRSDIEVYFEDKGPGSRVEMNPFDSQTGTVKSKAIDDFVKENEIESVGFIKMDIEGAELSALRGAIETIRKHKPKLAIALYHSVNDFVEIPKFIDDLNLGYNFHLGHYTIHSEETILFASTNQTNS